MKLIKIQQVMDGSVNDGTWYCVAPFTISDIELPYQFLYVDGTWGSKAMYFENKEDIEKILKKFKVGNAPLGSMKAPRITTDY